MKEIDSYRLETVAGTAVGIASFATGMVMGLGMYRGGLETTIASQKLTLAAQEAKSQEFLKSQPDECAALIQRLQLKVQDWREAADSVAKAGVCGNGSDGIVSQVYTDREAEDKLRGSIRDNENALNDWGAQIGWGGVLIGTVSTGLGKFTAFSIFCVADSINERRKKQAYIRSQASGPEASSYPTDQNTGQGYTNYPGAS